MTEPLLAKASLKKAQSYPFALEPLPFAYDALEPHIDAQTMELHHDKHHRTYVEKLNEALKDYPALHHLTLDDLLRGQATLPAEIRTAVRDNGGGHANHDFFWRILQPPKERAGRDSPRGDLAEALKQNFGSYEAFKKIFVEAGTKHFASGWVFLAMNPGDGKLEVFSRPNHATLVAENKRALLINDLWEHAYYLKYQNKRPDYLENFWNLVDWEYVGQQFKDGRAQAPTGQTAH